MTEESCFQRVMREAVEDGRLEAFKEFILEGVIVIADGLTDTDKAIIESWKAGKLN